MAYLPPAYRWQSQSHKRYLLHWIFFHVFGSFENCGIKKIGIFTFLTNHSNIIFLCKYRESSFEFVFILFEQKTGRKKNERDHWKVGLPQHMNTKLYIFGHLLTWTATKWIYVTCVVNEAQTNNNLGDNKTPDMCATSHTCLRDYLFRRNDYSRKNRRSFAKFLEWIRSIRLLRFHSRSID